MTKEAEYGSVVAHVVPHSRIVAKKKKIRYKTFNKVP